MTAHTVRPQEPPVCDRAWTFGVSHVGRALSDRATSCPDRVLLSFKDQRFTYEDINRRADCIARGFRALGIGRGDTVCIMLPNCPEFIFTWMGLAKLGAVAVPINPEYRAEGLRHLIQLSGAGILLIDAQYTARVGEIAKELPAIRQLIYLSASGDQPEAALAHWPCMPFHELSEGDTTGDPFAECAPTDPLMLIFTSGTTGPAKAVEISHRYALNFARQMIRHVGYNESDVLYTPYPLFHTDAPILSFLPALLLGARCALGVRFSASGFWDEVRNHGATVFSFLGAVISYLWDQPPRPDDADNPARLAVGCPTPAIWPQFEKRFGLKIVEVYGATECGHITWDPLDRPHKAGACGKPTEDYQLRIVDDEDNELPTAHTGEIVVRPTAPGMMMTRYYGNPEATAASFRELWYHTGDLGFVDSEGYLHFVSRKKDAIRRRGENISAYEIEEGIAAHPCVAEVAAIGVPSKHTEEDVKVVVVLKAGSSLSALELAEFARHKLARQMVPRYIEFVETLPKTPTGKVNKYKLRDQSVTAGTVDCELGGVPDRRSA
jgi:carnitine-CoA ligase